MPAANDTDRWRRLEHAVGGWPSTELQMHGFDLLYGEPDRLAADRRLHARRVLVARHALEEQVAMAGKPVLVMKGLEVAALYPRPIERPFRDLDVLVHDARPRWDRLVSAGYRKSPTRELDIDHHHLPALEHPTGVISVELHLRPNLPAWASVPTQAIFDTAEPSRTGVDGALRPSDDLHALLMAMHFWKGGAQRWRDLHDALLLASVANVDVERTAGALGLGRMWRATVRLAETLFPEPPAPPRRPWWLETRGVRSRRRVLVIEPLMLAGPTGALRAYRSLAGSVLRRWHQTHTA